MSFSVSWNRSSSFFGCLAMRALLGCGIDPPCGREQPQGGFITRQYIRAERSGNRFSRLADELSRGEHSCRIRSTRAEKQREEACEHDVGEVFFRFLDLRLRWSILPCCAGRL